MALYLASFRWLGVHFRSVVFRAGSLLGRSVGRTGCLRFHASLQGFRTGARGVLGHFIYGRTLLLCCGGSLCVRPHCRLCIYMFLAKSMCALGSFLTRLSVRLSSTCTCLAKGAIPVGDVKEWAHAFRVVHAMANGTFVWGYQDRALSQHGGFVCSLGKIVSYLGPCKVVVDVFGVSVYVKFRA